MSLDWFIKFCDDSSPDGELGRVAGLVLEHPAALPVAHLEMGKWIANLYVVISKSKLLKYPLCSSVSSMQIFLICITD